MVSAYGSYVANFDVMLHRIGLREIDSRTRIKLFSEID